MPRKKRITTPEQLRDELGELFFEIKAGKLDPRIASALGYVCQNWLSVYRVIIEAKAGGDNGALEGLTEAFNRACELYRGQDATREEPGN